MYENFPLNIQDIRGLSALGSRIVSQMRTVDSRLAGIWLENIDFCNFPPLNFTYFGASRLSIKYAKFNLYIQNNVRIHTQCVYDERNGDFHFANGTVDFDFARKIARFVKRERRERESDCRWLRKRGVLRSLCFTFIGRSPSFTHVTSMSTSSRVYYKSVKPRGQYFNVESKFYYQRTRTVKKTALFPLSSSLKITLKRQASTSSIVLDDKTHFSMAVCTQLCAGLAAMHFFYVL